MQLSRRHFLSYSAAAGTLALAGCQSRPLDAIALPAASQADVVTSGSHESVLALNFNENSLGLPPSAQRALQQAMPRAFRYPDAVKTELLTALAQHHQLAVEQLIYGNGSSEVLKMALDAMAEPDAQLVMPDPTFGVIEGYAQARGMKVVKVPLNAALQTDLPAMREAVAAHPGKSVVYLCNPNNPTGLMLPQESLSAWLGEASPHLEFIVDEAYGEYVTDPQFVSATQQVRAGNPHIAVARTFSKIYALAGLRVGYGMAQSCMITRMAQQSSVDNANVAGCVAASAALTDEHWLAHSLASNRQSLALVSETLTSLGLAILPCNANFVFHRINSDTLSYQQRMAEAGILVGRSFNHTDGWNRLSLGRPDEMLTFCQTLIAFRRKGWA